MGFEQYKEASNELETNNFGEKNEPKAHKLAVSAKHFWVFQIVFAIFIVNS